MNETALNDYEILLSKSLKLQKSYLSVNAVTNMLFGIKQLMMLGGMGLTKEQVVYIMTLQKLLERYEEKLKNFKL